MGWNSIARSPAPLLIVARLNRLAGLRNCKAAIHRAPLSIGGQRRRCWFGQRAVSSFEYTQDVSGTKHANRPRKLVGGRKEPGDKGEIAAGFARVPSGESRPAKSLKYGSSDALCWLCVGSMTGAPGLRRQEVRYEQRNDCLSDGRRWRPYRCARLRTTVIKMPVLSAAFSLLLPALLIVGGAGAVIAISFGAIWGAITAVLIVIGVPLVIMIKAWGFHAFLHR
jgi:hypothetical protein